METVVAKRKIKFEDKICVHDVQVKVMFKSSLIFYRDGIRQFC